MQERNDSSVHQSDISLVPGSSEMCWKTEIYDLVNHFNGPFIPVVNSEEYNDLLFSCDELLISQGCAASK